MCLQKLFDALKAASIAYTRMVVYVFAGYSLAGFGKFQNPGSAPLDEAIIMGMEM